MNLAITRTELTAITGIQRTKTFELQNKGLLRPTAKFANKTWFCISEVLSCAAALQGLETPSDMCIQAHVANVIHSRTIRNAK